MADTVVVTAPDAANAVLSPTLTDAIAAMQLYSMQVMTALAAVLAAESSVNNSEAIALTAASNALAAAAAAAASAGSGGISSTVALLPTGTPGLMAWATNGLKIGETSGSGTGVEVRFSAGFWRCVSTDAPVQA